ncbi:SDR family oxidoreductase [Sulfurivirga sp.]|uniref:SDR family oxidoreductase n=1 Tax=Sulfurivirga sp. TaxID=2614236 RepID=UPI0025FC138B|nr:NAD(P)H-binding protein [Sulfurivirga sp.]
MRLGKRIVVAGGSGFVGRALLEVLGEAGYAMTVLVRRPERCRELALYPNVRLRAWRPEDRDELTALMQGHDMLINLLVDQSDTLEAIPPEQFEKAGKALQHAANRAGIRRVLHLSYLGADSSAGGGWARQLGELEAAMHGVADAAVTTLRTSLLIGEGDDTASRYRDQLRHSRFLPVFGSKLRMQPLWVEDFARAAVGVLRNRDSFGQKWSIVGKEVLTLKDLALEVAELQGVDKPLIMDVCPANARLMRLLGPLAPRSIHPAQWVTLQEDRVDEMADFADCFGFEPASVEVALAAFVTPHDIRHRYNFFRKEAGRPLEELPRELL